MLPDTTNPYYIAMRDSIVKVAVDLGFDLKVAIAEDSNERQLAQAQSFVQQGICAAYLNGVDSSPEVAVIKAFNDAGIPVFTVNVIPSKVDMQAQSAHIVQYIGADQGAAGKAMAEEALKDFGATGTINFGIVGDQEQQTAEQRDAGWVAALASDPNAKQVAKVNGKIDPAVSLTVTTDMLQGNPSINVLWADTGPHAVGALQAIKQLNLSDKVKLYALCAADVEMTGPYIACSAQEPAKYGQMVLQNIKTYLSGQQVPPEIFVPTKTYRGGFTLPGEVG